MTPNEFQEWVRSKWKSKRGEEFTLRDDFIMTVGLGGETGEVLEILKKNVRDGKLDKTHLTEELGDVLYYLTMIAARHEIRLSDIIDANVIKLNERYKDRK